MKCSVCGKRTNWDESYGYPEFTVCPKCHDNILKTFKGDTTKTMCAIMAMGIAKRKAKGL